jgi:hypothetical protein
LQVLPSLSGGGDPQAIFRPRQYRQAMDGFFFPFADELVDEFALEFAIGLAVVRGLLTGAAECSVGIGIMGTGRGRGMVEGRGRGLRFIGGEYILCGCCGGY